MFLKKLMQAFENAFFITPHIGGSGRGDTSTGTPSMAMVVLLCLRGETFRAENTAIGGDAVRY